MASPFEQFAEKNLPIKSGEYFQVAGKPGKYYTITGTSISEVENPFKVRNKPIDSAAYAQLRPTEFSNITGGRGGGGDCGSGQVSGAGGAGGRGEVRVISFF